MGIFKELWWFFKQERKRYILGILALNVVALINLLPPYIIRLTIDEIANKTLTREYLGRIVLTVVCLSFFMYALRIIWRIALFIGGNKLGYLLRKNLYESLIRLNPSFYQKHRVGDLMAHCTNDVQAVEMTAGEGVLTLVESFFTGLLVIVSMILTTNWQLTLITLLPMPLMAWSMSYYGSILNERFDEAQKAFSELNSKVQENVNAVKVIKAFGLEKQEKREFQDIAENVVQKNMKVARIDALFDPTIVVLIGLSFFLAVAFGSNLVLQETITIGQLVQFTIYLGQFIWPMYALGWLINILEKGNASYGRIKRILEEQPEIKDLGAIRDKNLAGELSFKFKGFFYPEREGSRQEFQLEEIELKIPKGNTLGIVGKTGGGKSTLLKLLLREYDLPEGQITIGGINIKDYTLENLRQGIGYVPQDNFLFSDTIFGNIAFAKRNATLEEVKRAAKLASIHEEITAFPQGYQTLVGEKGVNLSGGQRQRIAIARTLLNDAPILILDDSLSAVDGRTEKRILDNLKEERAGKTTLIVSHRLSALEHAEEIIVLEEGRIRERGNHAELMGINGWYASTYYSQKDDSGEVKRGERA